MVAEGVAAADLLVSAAGRRRRASNGLAWASRRDVLDVHGLYDGCILGSGDRAILCAALGAFEQCTRALRMNGRQEQHYLAWARPYFDTVRGRIGYIPGRVLHLWHGEVADRRFGMRDQGLEAFGFDPFSDIALDAHDCWRWSSDKKDMHAFIRRYFETRDEDGPSDRRVRSCAAREPRPMIARTDRSGAGHWGGGEACSPLPKGPSWTT